MTDHAQDGVVFIDGSLAPLAGELDGVAHFVVMGEGETGGRPRTLRYEELLARAPAGVPDYPALSEREAAAG